MIAMFLLALIPFAGPVADHCDRIEINHFYDAHAKHVFTQQIAWEWDATISRFVVREWRLQKRDTPLPRRVGNRFELDWSGTILRAKSVQETWTQVDRELENRDLVPTGERREIRKRK